MLKITKALSPLKRLGISIRVSCCAIIVSFCNSMAKRRGQQKLFVWQRMFWTFIFMFHSTSWQLTHCLNYDKFHDTAPLMIRWCNFVLFQATSPWTGRSWERSGCARFRSRYSYRYISYSTDLVPSMPQIRKLFY